MLRLLLVLCCAAVLISGSHGDLPAGDNGSLPKPSEHKASVLESKIKTMLKEVASISKEDKDSEHPESSTTVANPASANNMNSPVTSPMTTPSAAMTNPPTTDETIVIGKTTQSTTIPPKTTTLPPKTTLPPTTTVPPKTTVPPTTTSTSSPPITTVAPKPVPPPTAGKWMVNETDTICVIVQMAVQFNISYVNTKKMEVVKVFDMPSDNKTTMATGVCGKSEQNLTLAWPSAVTNETDNMILHFKKNDTLGHYYLHHLEVALYAADLPNMTEPMVLVHEASAFKTGLKNSYRCMKQQKLQLVSSGVNSTTGYLTVSDLQFQAFKADNSSVFGLAKDCAFDTPDVVPIAVGCALAVLIVIVLIAYLVSRRRSQSRGYSSM